MADPIGANCRLDTKTGTRNVRCTEISYGVDIVSTEDTGRTGKSFNPMYTDSNAFAILLVFTSYAEAQATMNWFKSYVDDVLNDRADVMRVRIDAREFDRVGVPQSGMTFGQHVGQYVWTSTIQFVGARDPVTIKSTDLSQFVPGGGDYTQYGQYFYPAGTQLSGSASAEAWGGDIPTGFLLALGRMPDSVASALYGSASPPGPGG